MERSLYQVRLFPGTEDRYDEIHRSVPGAVQRGMTDSGLSNVLGFRRGTDVWWYAEAEPDRDTAFARVGKGVVNKRWGHQFRDVIAEVEQLDLQRFLVGLAEHLLTDRLPRSHTHRLLAAVSAKFPV